LDFDSINFVELGNILQEAFVLVLPKIQLGQ